MKDSATDRRDKVTLPRVTDAHAGPSLEDGEMSIAPLVDTNRNTNLDRARREFRPVAPRPQA